MDAPFPTRHYLVKREKSESDEKTMKAVDEILSGSFIDYKSNGSYRVEVLGINEKGKWEFGENNTSIINKLEKTEMIWNISFVSDNKLVLLKGNTNETWTFSALAPK